jgi:PPP family 3-phenylpropionic acid transporter
MALLARVQGASPELRTSLFYGTSFLGGGAAVVFLPIWLTEKGITPDQIGIINALPIALIVLMNLFMGRVADRASDWRQVIIVCSIAGGIIPFGLFFVHDFWGILLVWALLSLPGGAMQPVLDAAAVRLAKRNGSSYGVIRAWGTVGYLVMNALTGLLVYWFGSQIFVPLFVGLTIIKAVTSLILPRFRAPEREAVVVKVAGFAELRAAMQPWLLLPLVGFGMVYGTHWILNAFAALMWKQQGISEGIIGPLIAIGAISEAAMMFGWKRLGGQFPARYVIFISAIVTAFRWTVMAFSPPVYVLIPLQMLHGVTFALGFLGCVHFIANWTSEEIAAETQSLFAVLQQVMSVLSLIVFGWLVAFMGPHAYFVAAIFALLGGALVVLSLRMKPVQKRPV